MREETIIRTTSSLEADLDDLRDALFEGLTQYEGQLRHQCQLLPSWLALEFPHIWPLFCFDDTSDAPDAALGPRVIAVAAGELEVFVEDWLGLPQAPRHHSFSQDPTLRQRYLQDKTELESRLEGLMLESEHVAQQAKETLGRWRDDILAELEDSRIRDIDTIEQLVSEGTLEIGRDARAEIALLWEEQRRRAGALLRAWEPFESLISQGLEISRDGIEEIQNMLERAHQGLSQAYPSIARIYNERAHEAIIPTSVHEDPFGGAPRSPSSDSHDLLLISTPKDAQPQDQSADDDFDPYGVAASADDDALPYAFDDRFDDTPISDETPPPFGFDDEDEDEPGPTLPPQEIIAPMISFSDEVEPQASQQPEPELEPEPEHPTLFIAPGEHFGREEELDLEAKPTQPPRLGTAVKAHLPFILDDQTPLPKPPEDSPKTKPSVVKRPEDAPTTQAPAVEDAEVETLLTITREELRRDERIEQAELEAQDDDAHESGDEHAATQEHEDTREDDQPREDAQDASLTKPKPSAKPLTPHTPGWRSAPQETTGQRVQEQLVVLSRLIFAISFALPLSLVVGTLALAMASRHNPSLPNPLEPSPNMTHFIGIALLLWLIACPWVMRWQITWRGWRPMLWRYSRIHEEADILINDEHIELGHWMLRWDALSEVSLERWDDIHQGLQGWVLTITTLDDPNTPHRFSALATDEPTWARAAEPMTVHPEDAWRMSQRVFNKLVVASLGRSVGDDEH